MALPTKEGHLYKYRNRLQGWEYRYFKLTRSYLQYYHAQHAPAPKKAIVRSDITSVSVSSAFPERKYSFQITTKSDGTWYLDASSNEEMEQWVKALQAHLPPQPACAEAKSSTEKLNLTKEPSPELPITLPSYVQDYQAQAREPPPSYDDCMPT